MILFFNYFVIKNLQKEPFRLKLMQSVFVYLLPLGLLVLKKAPKGPDGGKGQIRGLQSGDPWKNEFIETLTLSSPLSQV